MPKPRKPASAWRSSRVAGRWASSMAFSVRIAARMSRALAFSPCAVMPTCCISSADSTAVGEEGGCSTGGEGTTAVLGRMRTSWPTAWNAKSDSWADEAGRDGGARSSRRAYFFRCEATAGRRAASARKFNCWGMNQAWGGACRTCPACGSMGQERQAGETFPPPWLLVGEHPAPITHLGAHMEQKKPVIRLGQLDGLGLIITHPSGVLYANQTGGYACHHPEMEGPSCL